MTQPTELNSVFIKKLLSKYNAATRQMHRDRCLLAIGVHAGIVNPKRSIVPSLSQEERYRVLYFLRQYCDSQGWAIEFR